jgi:hypothetical protein
VREQEVHLLAGLAVEHLGLRWPDGLPYLDCIAQQGIDGLGERSAGLVCRDVEQTDRVLSEHVVGVARDRRPVVLPTDAAQA